VGLLSQTQVAPEEPSCALAIAGRRWKVIIPPQPETLQLFDGALRFCKLGDIAPSLSIVVDCLLPAGSGDG
jgi:hypothetical protein